MKRPGLPFQNVFQFNPDLPATLMTSANIFHAAHASSALWRLEYNFSTFYNLPDISVATLESLSRQLRTNR